MQLATTVWSKTVAVQSSCQFFTSPATRLENTSETPIMKQNTSWQLDNMIVTKKVLVKVYIKGCCHSCSSIIVHCAIATKMLIKWKFFKVEPHTSQSLPTAFRVTWSLQHVPQKCHTSSWAQEFPSTQVNMCWLGSWLHPLKTPFHQEQL